jgi:hypothetical protein
MKTLTFFNRNEALVAALAALWLCSAVAMVTLAPYMARIAYVILGGVCAITPSMNICPAGLL